MVNPDVTRSEPCQNRNYLLPETVRLDIIAHCSDISVNHSSPAEPGTRTYAYALAAEMIARNQQGVCRGVRFLGLHSIKDLISLISLQ